MNIHISYIFGPLAVSAACDKGRLTNSVGSPIFSTPIEQLSGRDRLSRFNQRRLHLRLIARCRLICTSLINTTFKLNIKKKNIERERKQRNINFINCFSYLFSLLLCVSHHIFKILLILCVYVCEEEH